MDEEFVRSSDLRSELRGELVVILLKVVKQVEFATEIAEERLDQRKLVREVSTDPRLMDHLVLEYGPVLDAQQTLSSLHDEQLRFWTPDWRPDRRNLAAIFVGLAIPSVAVWLLSTFSFLNGTITALVPFVLLGAMFAALGFLVRRGLPETVWQRLKWELSRLRARAAHRGDEHEWRQAVRDAVVVPYVREWINGAKKPTFDTLLTLRDGSGLQAQGGEDPLVQTQSIEAFRRELSRPDPGAIGIAGPRGVGKSTLMESALDNAFTGAGQPPFLNVAASAPVRYDAREFMLHLYAITCRAVLRTAGPDEQVPAESEDELVWRRLRRRAVFISRAWYGFRVILTSALWAIASTVPLIIGLDLASASREVTAARVSAMVDGLLTDPANYLVPWHWNLLLQISAMMMLAYAMIKPAWLVTRYLIEGFAALLFGEWRRRVRRYYSLEHKALCALAWRDLRQVRFLQTRTEGWSGKLSSGGLFELGLTRTIARAERPLTHPEIVDDYRRLLERVVSVLAPDDIRGVIVGIDELDKFADAAQAREFIDEIKGIFGVKGCVFLVSVSEDALTSFHRRGIPVRDAFDSAFTTVVRIEPFTLDDARAWLAKRAIGIPEPFIHLCYCFSGGLPRELRRTAVAMYDRHTDSELESDLDSIVPSLVATDLSAKLKAFASAAVQLEGEADPSSFLVTVTSAVHGEAPWMISQCVALLPDDDAGIPTALSRLHWEAASYLYFSATIVEFFTNSLTPKTVRLAMSDGSVVSLASARQQMSIDPRVSWQLITDFRRRRGLTEVGHLPDGGG
ncbi:hypothetical protein [Amycolatopsis sp. NPDC051061]|uniref:hypothetical protein n=1 Tax=Amycolatopsis sp. NPDC051061 TaxID=3155042 RepID=UPI003421BA5B